MLITMETIVILEEFFKKNKKLFMITLSKHFFISLLTAINLSKKKGLKFFFEVFVIRFFYAFDLIRSSLSSSNYNKSDILSKNFFMRFRHLAD